MKGEEQKRNDRHAQLADSEWTFDKLSKSETVSHDLIYIHFSRRWLVHGEVKYFTDSYLYDSEVRNAEPSN